MSRTRWCAALLAALAAGCVGMPEPDLPDLRRGVLALQTGDVEGAEYDLAPLARAGYLEAQVKLADLYAQLGTQASMAQAVHWYRVAFAQDPSVALPLARLLLRLNDVRQLDEAERFLHEAERRGDPRALAALIELYTDRPERDKKGVAPALVERAAAIPTPQTEAAVVRWYRANAAQPQYARRLIERCELARDRLPECYVDLTRHYRAQGDKRRVEELSLAARRETIAGGMPRPLAERVGWSLASDEHPGAPLPELAYPLLELAQDATPTAQVRMARLLVEYPYLDPHTNPERLLLDAVDKGSPEAALALGRLYVKGVQVAADPRKAEHYLLQAAEALPQAHYLLGQVYKRGMLGSADPVRAAHHLLTAARGGYARADLALAQLFSESRGARVNRTNAYVFASLATAAAVPASAELLAQLRAAMSAEERRAADALLRRETAARHNAAPMALPQSRATAVAGTGGER